MIEILVVGTVKSEPRFSHKTWGEKFYEFSIASERHSGVIDNLPCVASEVIAKGIKAGDRVKVQGDLRSFRHYDSNKCEIYIFADILETPEPDEMDQNEAWGEAYISKTSEPRETPLLRIITDMILKSVLGNNKFSYIPSITWSRNAIRAANMPRGTLVRIDGRFQSRQYTKVLENGEAELRIAYELSLAIIEVIDDETEEKDA